MFEDDKVLRTMVQKLIPRAKQFFDQEVGAFDLPDDESRMMLVFVTCRLLSLIAKKTIEENGWELMEIEENHFHYKKDPNEKGH